jgi:hypothetical protein
MFEQVLVRGLLSVMPRVGQTQVLADLVSVSRRFLETTGEASRYDDFGLDRIRYVETVLRHRKPWSPPARLQSPYGFVVNGLTKWLPRVGSQEATGSNPADSRVERGGLAPETAPRMRLRYNYFRCRDRFCRPAPVLT